MTNAVFITTEQGHVTRILSPEEFDRFNDAIKNPHMKSIFEVSFWTGMRYSEVQKLWLHPNWWVPESMTIFLPRNAEWNGKRATPTRTIRNFPPKIIDIMDEFFKLRQPPALSTWSANLKRWAKNAGLPTRGISSLTSRKTIEAWMLSAGISSDIVYRRHGSCHKTICANNVSGEFSQNDKDEIKTRLAGWME